MQPARPSATPHRRQQQGFSLVEVVIAILVATALATLAASFVKREVDDAAAQGTGKYLLQLRAAVIDLQLKHEAWLRGENLPDGATPTSPKLAWTAAGGAQVAYGSVADLKTLGLLPTDTPRYPALGDLARFVLVRQGACPSQDCHTSAFVYTCHPIGAQRSLRSSTACTAPAGARGRYSQALLGQVLQAADGYGGHDALNSTNVQGPLMDVPRRLVRLRECCWARCDCRWVRYHAFRTIRAPRRHPPRHPAQHTDGRPGHPDQHRPAAQHCCRPWPILLAQRFVRLLGGTATFLPIRRLEKFQSR